MQNLGRIAVRVKSLAPGDSLGKAAEAVRASTVGAVPVVDRGMLLGLATAACLARYFTEHGVETAMARTVSSLELERAVPIPETVGAADALYYFQSQELAAAPVVDSTGGLVGMVSQAELASAACGRAKLPVIGGMATPFGVYLTGGGVRGGVGDFALMTTGMFMAIATLLAVQLAHFLLAPPEWAGPLYALSRWTDSWSMSAQTALGAVMTALMFGLIFRLSWVTGFHAAEHQTVHALEAGEDLSPEVVGRMPRVHPRCGTNIVAAVSIMALFWEAHWLGTLAVPLGMLTTAITWRRVGGVLQQYFTTRPASRSQLESGIRAATQLIERYEQGPVQRVTFWRRLWNMGLPQVMLGSMIVYLPLILLPLPESLKVGLF